MLAIRKLAVWVLCVVAPAPFVPVHAAPQLLPDDVVPIHYDLLLAPDADALKFRGNVAIKVDVKTPTADIVLNSVGLAFDTVALDGSPVSAASFDEKLGRATLRFAAPVQAGQHTLSIAYHSTLGHETLGFFAMDYVSPAGPRRTLATNFEPTFARKLLPCWDEPGRKATFTISVDAPKDRMAVSNMPVAKTSSLSATMQRVQFATSPKMSTYLLFVGIGDFERIHRMVDGTDVGVVVKRGDTAKAAYALDQAGKLLHYYNGYFGAPFPLPKLDLIAAPGEIEGGSMENWGAIFYSQNHVLFDPTLSTEQDRQTVFLVVSHEMAHQWFGDLVTMAWWDNLWLNEGFARWMQTTAADALHPEWKTGLQAQSIFDSGKQADSLPSTHPILQSVDTAEQALQAFDGITYNKGAAVIAMLNAYIGPDAFRDGVRQYMHAHAYGNTVDTDLWSIMQTVAGKPILDIEHDFTRQEGLPLVRVALTPEGLHLTEDRFFAEPSTVPSASAQHWPLPLTIGAPNAVMQTILLKDAADVPQHSPVLVNAGQTAYVRVLYPQAAIADLLPGVKSLAPVDQLGLLNDSVALGLAGDAQADRVLDILANLPLDADPIVWRRAVSTVTALDRRYAEKPSRAAFRRYARNLLVPVADRWGTEAMAGEDANAPLLRSEIAQALGILGDETVIARARQMMAGGSGTPAQKRAALFVAAAQADAAGFDALLARARATRDPLEKLHIYQALGGVQDTALARRMIDIALSDEVPAGSNAGILSPLAANHPDLLWNEAVPRLGEPKAALPKSVQWTVAQAIAGNSSDPRRVDQLEAYEEKNVPADARKPFLGAIASIRQNQRIAAQALPQLDTWIAAQPSKR
jgi:aminopeptidase N